MPELPYDVEKAVETEAEYIAEILSQEFEDFDDLDDCRAYVHGRPHDDTTGIDLDFDDRVDVLTYLADEHGHQLEGVTVGNLRSKVESLASILIEHEARSRVDGALDDLASLMDDEEIDFDDAAPNNAYGHARHWGERDAGADCTVYQYRNIEGIHVDLYVFRMFSAEFHFAKFLDSADLTDEERNWESF